MKKKAYTRSTAFLRVLTERVLSGKPVTPREAKKIAALQFPEDIVFLLAHASRIRHHFRGEKIALCAIVNAKSGRCSEDCIFCAQSMHYKTRVTTYPLLPKDKILAQAQAARNSGAGHFSIVTSGRGIPQQKGFLKICESIAALATIDSLVPCASLGILTREHLLELRAAGLRRYHHNLETAESHFSSICTTHTYHQRIATIRMAQEDGLEVCAGGILGMGETPLQRIELAFTLRDLEVESVPLNFLNPIPGTPAARYALLPPLELLKSIALFRFILPSREIRVCGGRETGLRTLQPLMYLAGADGAMTGNYLTTAGRDTSADRQEIFDLGLIPGF